MSLLNDKLNTWAETDGIDYTDTELGIAHCFKWPVPKLQDKGYMVELYSYEQKGYKVSVYHITGQVDIPVAITTNETPALAVCLAIEKLIDGEEK